MTEYMPETAWQAAGFFYSAGLGFALGLVYDCFRIFFYLLTGSDKKSDTARDIMYMFFCLAVNFLFLLVMCSGKLMLYVFVGEAMGLSVYLYTLSGNIYRPARKKIARIRGFLSRLFMKLKEMMSKFSQLMQIRRKNTKKQENFSENT